MVSTTNYHYKKNNSANVAICVPVQNQVTAVFAYSLAMLQKKCGETGLATSLHFNMGSEVAMQRQQLVDQALETDCSHIMWIDADMQFPVDTLNILLAADKDIIAGNYSTRVPPHRPVAFKSKNNLDSRVFAGKGIEKVYIKKIKELIENGKIGKLQYIYSNRLNLGTIRTEENVFWSLAQ